MTRLCGVCGEPIKTSDYQARRYVFSTVSRTYYCLCCALKPAAMGRAAELVEQARRP